MFASYGDSKVKHSISLLLKGASGFTLIELVVVIVILGILSATAMPKYINMKRQARIAAVQGIAGGLRSAATLSQAAFRAKNPFAGRYRVEELTAVQSIKEMPELLDLGTGTRINVWREPYRVLQKGVTHTYLSDGSPTGNSLGIGRMMGCVPVDVMTPNRTIFDCHGIRATMDNESSSAANEQEAIDISSDQTGAAYFFPAGTSTDEMSRTLRLNIGQISTGVDDPAAPRCVAVYHPAYVNKNLPWPLADFPDLNQRSFEIIELTLGC